MRSHSQIIADAGGAKGLHDALGFTDKIHTVRSWAQRDSIPAEQWAEIARAEIATLEELAEAAERRRTADERATSA